MPQGRAEDGKVKFAGMSARAKLPQSCKIIFAYAQSSVIRGLTADKCAAIYWISGMGIDSPRSCRAWSAGKLTP